MLGAFCYKWICACIGNVWVELEVGKTGKLQRHDDISVYGLEKWELRYLDEIVVMLIFDRWSAQMSIGCWVSLSPGGPYL